jgi:hypothetical protein
MELNATITRLLGDSLAILPLPTIESMNGEMTQSCFFDAVIASMMLFEGLAREP